MIEVYNNETIKDKLIRFLQYDVTVKNLELMEVSGSVIIIILFENIDLVKIHSKNTFY